MSWANAVHHATTQVAAVRQLVNHVSFADTQHVSVSSLAFARLFGPHAVIATLAKFVPRGGQRYIDRCVRLGSCGSSSESQNGSFGHTDTSLLSVDSSWSRFSFTFSPGSGHQETTRYLSSVMWNAVQNASISDKMSRQRFGVGRVSSKLARLYVRDAPPCLCLGIRAAVLPSDYIFNSVHPLYLFPPKWAATSLSPLVNSTGLHILARSADSTRGGVATVRPGHGSLRRIENAPDGQVRWIQLAESGRLVISKAR